MNKKFIVYFLIILLIFNITWLIYISSFNLAVFHNKNFYKKEFTKLGVYDDLKDYDVDKINNEVLDYLSNKKTASRATFSPKGKKTISWM